MTTPTTDATAGASAERTHYRPRPWLAALLSLLMPGVGHLYAAAPLRGAIALTVVLAAFVFFPWLVVAAPPSPITAFLVWAGSLGILVLAAVDAWRVARKSHAGVRRGWYNHWYVYLASILVINVAVFAPLRSAIRNHLTQAFHVPSGAMEPTLLVGDVLFADKRKSAREPGRGDVIIAESPEDAGLLVVERAVGISGDTLAMRAGVLTRNGVTVLEPYLQIAPPLSKLDTELLESMRRWQVEYVPKAEREKYSPTISDWGPLIVPQDSYFLLGDNRNRSYDSRFYGFVPATLVRGQPHLIYWSYDPGNGGRLAWLTRPRFERFGIGVVATNRSPTH